jgi:hypothetical protein
MPAGTDPAQPEGRNRTAAEGVRAAMSDVWRPSSRADGVGLLAAPRAARPAVLTALVAVLAMLAVAGCGSPGSAGPTIEPRPTIEPSPTVGPIDHPTGATTVILRVDEGGGFVPPSFFVTQAPAFSLYGDGWAIFRDPAAEPPPAIGEVRRSVPFQAVRLGESEVQALLSFALGPGGLGTARAQYQLPVADAPTTTFTVVAGGLDKTVSVNGLGIGADSGPDAATLTALTNLRTRLMGFGAAVAGERPWVPDRYRGILMEAIGGGDQPGQLMDWPWPDVQPSDFTAPLDPNLARWPTRVMLPAEVAALGLSGLEGGVQGILLNRPAGVPAGMPYEFALRPLLTDESR